MDDGVSREGGVGGFWVRPSLINEPEPPDQLPHAVPEPTDLLRSTEERKAQAAAFQGKVGA